MTQKYEVINSKLELENPIIIHVHEITKLEKIEIEYPQGIYKPRIETFYDVEFDDGSSARLREENAKDLFIGQLVHYNVSVDDYVLFVPENFKVKIQRIA